MRTVPCAVVIVTSALGDEPVGATIGSFTSVSLNPPLVSFNVMHNTRLHDALEASGRLNVNVLSTKQAELADQFSIPDLDGHTMFSKADHAYVDGLPMLNKALSVLTCSVETRMQTPDHTLYLCRVDNVVLQREDAPLLYLDRSYRTIGDSV